MRDFNPRRRCGSLIASAMFSATVSASNSGLAGAVLAEQRVDLAGADGEADAVVGDGHREALHDAFKRQQRCVVPHAWLGGVVCSHHPVSTRIRLIPERRFL
jgi:hypothetical protein